jgi:hypothetical protein
MRSLRNINNKKDKGAKKGGKKQKTLRKMNNLTGLYRFHLGKTCEALNPEDKHCLGI